MIEKPAIELHYSRRCEGKSLGDWMLMHANMEALDRDLQSVCELSCSHVSGDNNNDAQNLSGAHVSPCIHKIHTVHHAGVRTYAYLSHSLLPVFRYLT